MLNPCVILFLFSVNKRTFLLAFLLGRSNMNSNDHFNNYLCFIYGSNSKDFGQKMTDLTRKCGSKQDIMKLYS